MQVQKGVKYFSGSFCEPGYFLRVLCFGRLHICPRAPFLLPHHASSLWFSLWFSLLLWTCDEAGATSTI